jgi:glucose/mannose-6-phosphate isomerase
MNGNQSMNHYIQRFPNLLLQGLTIGAAYKFKATVEKNNISNVALLGLGGSGIGAEVINNYLLETLEIPVILCRDYSLPAFVSEKTLVIASSYSGNTEETMCALKAAIKKEAQILCITSGGEMKAVAEAFDLDCIILPAGLPPRACFPCSMVQVLFGLKHFGLVDFAFEQELTAAAAFLQSIEENIKSEGAAIAKQLIGKVPVIYVDQKISGVGTRWRQQLNENSKVLGWERVIPEMNHNELVGWRDEVNNLAVIMLHTGLETENVRRRFEITGSVAGNCTDTIIHVAAKGNNLFERVLYLVLLGDWTSWYLAELRGVDAVEVKVIDYLKAALAK